MSKKYLSLRGFTVVELTVVIAVIAILSSIGIVSFRTYKADTEIAVMKKDMQALNLAIEKYYAKNGSYPIGALGSGSSNWARRHAHGQSFAGGIYPEFIKVVPDVEHGDKSNSYNNTYIYTSDGADYKLLRLVAPGAGQQLPPHEVSSIEPELQDPNTSRWSPSTKRAWGYWSQGAEGW